MKNHMFALCLSLFAVSCDPKNSQATNGLTHLDHVSGMQEFLNGNEFVESRELGWVDYLGSQWNEVGPDVPTSQYVVQMGMKRREKCADGLVCYDAQPVTTLHEDGNLLCPIALASAGPSIPKQHSVGVFTGVLVERAKDSPVVVTVHHGKRYLKDGDILFDHFSNASSSWLNATTATLAVPKAHTGLVNLKNLRTWENPDLMILELQAVDSKRAGVALATESLCGKQVYAIAHVFGLPMKKTNFAPVTDCDDEGFHCYVQVDLAVGGSGGPLFTEDGKLAGILVGTGLKAMEHCEHKQEKLHPCPGSGDGLGCPDLTSQHPKSQKFVTAKAIQMKLEKPNP